MTRTWRVLAGVGVGSIVVAALLGYLVTRGGGPGGADDVAGPAQEEAAPPPAERFLDRYVTDEGRVVRRDQGGDTVSEGQAYAMLMAVHAGEAETFDRVWRWTYENLRRPDGLLSWRWHDGTVAANDRASAADADLDAARALVLAARRFDRPAYRRDGVALGTAILDHETAPTPRGRMLLAGSWAAAGDPVNPSYVSPVAMRLLAEASGDPRWDDLRRGSTAVVRSVTGPGRLPPDWAALEPDGTASPGRGPSGEPVQYGYDAARTVIRYAESCRPADRRLAARAAGVLGRDPDVVAVHGVRGAPRTGDVNALALVAHAAALAADDDDRAARRALRAAAAVQRDHPGYYGDAWAVLGPMLLRHTDLGGCPPLEENR